jgi:hypothetical protein
MGKTGICLHTAGVRDQQLCERGIVRVASEAIIIHAHKRMKTASASGRRPRQ